MCILEVLELVSSALFSDVLALSGLGVLRLLAVDCEALDIHLPEGSEFLGLYLPWQQLLIALRHTLLLIMLSNLLLHPKPLNLVNVHLKNVRVVLFRLF